MPRCRHQSRNVANDDEYVRDLTTTLEKIRIASVRADVRRTIRAQLGHRPPIRIRRTTYVYQKPSTGEFAKYSVNKVVSFSNK